MNESIKKQILDKIKENNRIIITRHIRPDGDCYGGTTGLREIIKDSFPNKEVSLFTNDTAQYLEFLGLSDEDKGIDYYKDALVIVLDTATKDRISNLYFENAKEIIKIDHHIETDPYGSINWVEDYRSSLCEMIVDFYLSFIKNL